MTRHSTSGSAAATSASERACAGVIGPIRPSCPGSPDSPVRVDHGSCRSSRPPSAGRRFPIAAGPGGRNGATAGHSGGGRDTGLPTSLPASPSGSWPPGSRRAPGRLVPVAPGRPAPVGPWPPRSGGPWPPRSGGAGPGRFRRLLVRWRRWLAGLPAARLLTAIATSRRGALTRTTPGSPGRLPGSGPPAGGPPARRPSSRQVLGTASRQRHRRRHRAGGSAGPPSAGGIYGSVPSNRPTKT